MLIVVFLTEIFEPDWYFFLTKQSPNPGEGLNRQALEPRREFMTKVSPNPDKSLDR